MTFNNHKDNSIQGEGHPHARWGFPGTTSILVPVMNLTAQSYFIMVALVLVITWPTTPSDWAQKLESNNKFQFLWNVEWPNFSANLLVDFSYGPIIFRCEKLLMQLTVFKSVIKQTRSFRMSRVLHPTTEQQQNRGRHANWRFASI